MFLVLVSSSHTILSRLISSPFTDKETEAQRDVAFQLLVSLGRLQSFLFSEQLE